MELLEVHTVREVKDVILQRFKPINEYIEVPIIDAVNMVLAQDILSKEDVPSFNRSTVDGYAVKASDTYGSTDSMPSFFKIIGEVEMGQLTYLEIGNGEAAYVPTGGMIPKGADAVIMIEDVKVIGELLNAFEQVRPRENVIFQGEDVKRDSLILDKGHRLRPQDLGGLAAIGVSTVLVYRKLKVGILSSGDEIVPPETKVLAAGQIRDINGVSISAAVQAFGGEFIYAGIVKDNFEQYLTSAKSLFTEVDFLILSGGSSMGEKDFTSKVMNKLGEPGVLVHGISIKPGKPTLLADCNGKPVLGLPGHPVSAYVLFDLFGTMIMNQLRGEEAYDYPKHLKAKIARNVPSQVGRTDYIRVKLELRDNELYANPVFGKSGLITNLVKSDGVVEISEFKDGVAEGELVNVTLYL